MKIEKIIQILGRGFVFLGKPNKEIKLGDKVKIEDAEFDIVGIEGATNIKHVGLILSPNKSAYICIKEGDEIEIISK